MNKILLVGRLVRDPETNATQSNIKYTRFTVAVSRPFADDQADFIPVVAWRNQASFVEQYMRKGSQIAIEGRMSSSTYQKDGQNITRYEVTADRIESLGSRNQARNDQPAPINRSAASTQEIEFAKENKPEAKKEVKEEEIPWELEL